LLTGANTSVTGLWTPGTDINAQGGAAWNAAFALQEHPELRDTAVLLLPSTPVAQPASERVTGLDLGWVSLVPKPFTASAMMRPLALPPAIAIDAAPASKS